jgi:formylglycine-generating enzyme required for sulfatase activity
MADQESLNPEGAAGGHNVRLASIVAIDIVGFSTMSERDQKRAAKHVHELRARIESVAAGHRGRLFNTAGDGFMLEFGSAGDALTAIQDLIDKRPKGEPPIRVGAHVGDAIVTATQDLLGHGVNVAARLQSLAAPGAALVSSEFRSMARNSPSAAFQARGRQPLDNIEQKVQTFEILSQRQKLQRTLKRVGSGVVAAAAFGAAVFLAPKVWPIAQQFLAERASAAAPAQPAAPTEQVQAVAAPAAAPTLPETEVSFVAGQQFRDCASCPEMVVLSGGLFTMGSPNNELGRRADEGPQREVSIAPFAIARAELTFAQWDACVSAGACPSIAGADRAWGRGDRPAIGLSWADAQVYVGWINAQVNGPRYHLPSEAEWEFAARGGTQTPYATGVTIGVRQAVYHARRTERAGAFPANAFNLVDMHGNAAEWVQDCYAPNYLLAPIDGAPIEFDSCPSRVYRGGSYADLASALRSAARGNGAPDVRIRSAGVRLARALQ